jgi:hypothetical protein
MKSTTNCGYWKMQGHTSIPTLRTVHITKSSTSLFMSSVHNRLVVPQAEFAVSQQSTGPGSPRTSRRYASLFLWGSFLRYGSGSPGGQNLLWRTRAVIECRLRLTTRRNASIVDATYWNKQRFGRLAAKTGQSQVGDMAILKERNSSCAPAR